ncbi:flap endonuclease GEN-like 1 isoform X2 [Durio zibethinus]|uniref:Flap endonuclease GEN-like 1 n=1 Tax=Durio zibethinus TaxID=66656 RepID=A0A6P6AZM6_DURZI|nr:flap endonuclease GEN-like 1 isoform X2 [Durio zibethinus]
MGVGGKFWELLKPYARLEGYDFLRDKKVAIDLSFWIVQHETALKNQATNPHLRLTFFRTINLFSKFGVFPVFVLDGTPSPLKSQARMARFFRFSGIDTSTSNVAKEGVRISKERNSAFSKCVNDCVELLGLLGMPVLKANGEAEALCAQLNRDGHVDACITADSDAFLFGATCVIKCLRPHSKEPFECYNMSDIEAGLGLKRKHLIAISLLVGNDHDLNGVHGIGLDKALRFVQQFSEDEIFNKLYEISKGDVPLFQDEIRCADDVIPCLDESSPKPKQSHCSFCGHPGSKKAHFKFSCEYCVTDNNEGCLKKLQGYKCNCSSCDKVRKEKDKKKKGNWWIKVCNMITREPNFPNDEIIEMYMCNNRGVFTDGPLLRWRDPKTELVVDFLAYHQSWQPSYVRQWMLPMLSTIYLREMARNPNKTLLVGQYEFHSIQRVKIRYGHQSYVVKWKKAISDELSCAVPVEKSNMLEEEFIEVDDVPIDQLDESIDPQIHVDGCWILTDETPELVHSAFPEEVVKFRQEKELKEMKRRKTSKLRSEGSSEMSELSKPQGVQLSITEFYCSTKKYSQAKPVEDLTKYSSNPGDGSSKQERKVSSPNLSKAVRRRLLFG